MTSRAEEFERRTFMAFIHKALYEKFDRSFKKQDIREMVARKYARQRDLPFDDPAVIHVLWAVDRFVGLVLKHQTDGIQDYQCFVEGAGEVWRLSDAMTLRQWEASLASARKNARRVSASLKQRERDVELFRSLVAAGEADIITFGDVREDFIAHSRVAA